MTHRATILRAGMIALAIAATRPAMADVYYVTYTGTASGTDTNGVFGTAGATLNNVAYSSTYTYDPARLGSSATGSTSGGTYVYTYAFGGSVYGALDPLLSANITIGGQTYSQSSSYIGRTWLFQQPSSQIREEAFSSNTNYLENDDTVNGSATLSFTALQSFSVSSDTGVFAYDGEQITLSDTHVSVTDGPPATVPEPASLALLTTSAAMFGLALAATRRTPKQNAVA